MWPETKIFSFTKRQCRFTSTLFSIGFRKLCKCSHKKFIGLLKMQNLFTWWSHRKLICFTSEFHFLISKKILVLHKYERLRESLITAGHHFKLSEALNYLYFRHGRSSYSLTLWAIFYSKTKFGQFLSTS